MIKKRILVTGVGGFIFSNFMRKAIYERHPYSYVSIDNASKTSVLNNIYSNKNHQFYLADITDAHLIDRIFELERPDIVVHGAALTHVDESIKDPMAFIRTNVMGTQVMVDAAVKWGIQKFLYVGTDEHYGQLTSDSDPPWKEDAPANPRNPYSASKTAGELIVKAAHATHGLQYNITRSSNNYGPRQTPDKLIPKIIKCWLEDKPIPIYGQGQQMRDWTHVFDNCSGILGVLNHGQINETYNISSNQEFTNLEVVYEVTKCLTAATGITKNLITFVEDRKGHDFRYSVDSSKLRALGWAPAYRFKSGGLEQTVNWYLDNKYQIT